MSNCKTCNFQLSEGSVYCSKCGSSEVVLPLTELDQIEIKVKPKGRSTMFIVIMSSFFVIIFIVGVIGAFESSRAKDSQQKWNRLRIIVTLRSFADTQKLYKTDYKVFGTIEKIGAEFNDDLRSSEAEYVFYDLIKEPGDSYYAVLASPKVWGLSDTCHYLITSAGIVREWNEKELPFGFSLPATQESVNIINKLKEAR